MATVVRIRTLLNLRDKRCHKKREYVFKHKFENAHTPIFMPNYGYFENLLLSWKLLVSEWKYGKYSHSSCCNPLKIIQAYTRKKERK